MSLATVADLAAALRKEIDPADTAALAALENASAIVEAYLGQPVELVEDDEITIDGPGITVVLLPCYPVTEIGSIEEDGEELDPETDFEWSANGHLRRLNRDWTSHLRGLVVTYSHGYATVPTAIKSVVVAMAGRLYDVPFSVRQESIGGYSVTYAAQTGPTLQAAEALILDSYKRVR